MEICENICNETAAIHGGAISDLWLENDRNFEYMTDHIGKEIDNVIEQFQPARKDVKERMNQLV